MYKLGLKKANPTRKSPLHKMISTPEHGYEYEKPTFDNEYENAVIPKSPKIATWFDSPFGETKKVPGTSREVSPQSFSQSRGIMWQSGDVFPDWTRCGNEFGTTQSYSYQPPHYEIQPTLKSKTKLKRWLQILKLWAALLLSIERIRRRSSNLRNALRHHDVAIQKLLSTHLWIMPGD